MSLKNIIIYVLLINFCFSENRIDGVSAIVDNKIILHSDILERLQYNAVENQIDLINNPDIFKNMYISTLNDIIKQYVVLSVAEKDTNIVLSNDEIDRILNQQIESSIIQAGSKDIFLDMVGMSMRQIKADWWSDIKNMMMVERFQMSKVQSVDISRIEVQNFYNIYKDSIPINPKKYSFSVIEIPYTSGKESNDKIFDFLVDLKYKIEIDNHSFDSLAVLFSEDPGSAGSGGYLGFTHRGSLVSEYEKIAFAMNVGEISMPVLSKFGYHLIKLLDRRGEKISTQHILIQNSYSNEDKLVVQNKIDKIYSLCFNNPLVFDSLAYKNSLKYKNNSGKYINISLYNIPDNIYKFIQNLNVGILSKPIKTDNGCLLIYLHNYINEINPNLDNSWDLIYNYAKQNKQMTVFNNLIDSLKNNIYIHINKKQVDSFITTLDNVNK